MFTKKTKFEQLSLEAQQLLDPVWKFSHTALKSVPIEEIDRQAILFNKFLHRESAPNLTPSLTGYAFIGYINTFNT
jgi:hypothetical protein